MPSLCTAFILRIHQLFIHNAKEGTFDTQIYNLTFLLHVSSLFCHLQEALHQNWEPHQLFSFCPMPPHVLVDFVVLPPGHGRSVTEFWGWDVHEAQLRCPDDVSGDTGGCSARRALKPKFYQLTQTMVTAGILPFKENSHDRAGNRTRDLMISSQDTLTTRPLKYNKSQM